jgi:hypothetical protein
VTPTEYLSKIAVEYFPTPDPTTPHGDVVRKRFGRQPAHPQPKQIKQKEFPVLQKNAHLSILRVVRRGNGEV